MRHFRHRYHHRPQRDPITANSGRYNLQRLQVMSRVGQAKLSRKIVDASFRRCGDVEKYHRIAGPKPRCAGCRNVTFDTGDTMLSVDGLYVPRDKDFCV